MKHLHKYIKRKLSRNSETQVYACIEPGCTHYLSMTMIVGKEARCPRCNNKYTITSDMVRKGQEMLKPHCKGCTKSRRVKPDESKVANILAAFGIKSEA